MKVLLIVAAVISFLFGALTLVGAWTISNSAIHEIEAFVLFLIGAIFVTGVTVIGAIDETRKELVYYMRWQANSTSAKGVILPPPLARGTPVT